MPYAAKCAKCNEVSTSQFVGLVATQVGAEVVTTKRGPNCPSKSKNHKDVMPIKNLNEMCFLLFLA